MGFFVSMCKRFNYAWLCEGEPKVSKEFSQALEFLKWPVTARDIIAFSRFALFASVLFFMALAAAFWLVGWSILMPVLAAVAVPFLALHLVSEYPKQAAFMKAVQALGEAPKTLTYLIISLKQKPNLEEAVRFAAEHGEGAIAEELKQAAWKTWSGKSPSVKHELPKIGEKWGKYSPEFRQALLLVAASLSEKSEERRLDSLDRALRSALDGITAKMRSFASGLQTPTLVMFSFGAILPLMFVAMLPMLILFGISFGSPLEIAGILGLMLAVIYAYSNNILSKRPPSFSQPSIPDLVSLPKKNEINIFGKNVNSALFCIALAVLVGAPSFLYLFVQAGVLFVQPGSLLAMVANSATTLFLLWGVGAGLALSFYGFAAPRKKLRDEVVKLEGEVLDMMYVVADRLAEGRPPEDALRFAGEAAPESSIGKIFTETSMLVRRRNVTLDQAFFDKKFGSVRNVYSKTVLLIFKVFSAAVKKGYKAASQIVHAMVDYFSQLKKIERESSEALHKTTSMLQTTVSFFAPMICGIVVTLYATVKTALTSAQEQFTQVGYQQGVGSIGMVKPPALTSEVLQLIVGVYMLVLSIILVRYVCMLEYGPDEVEMKLAIAKALPVALTVFTVALLFSKQMIPT